MGFAARFRRDVAYTWKSSGASMTRGGFKNMNVVARAAGPPRFGKQILASLVSLALLSVTWPLRICPHIKATRATSGGDRASAARAALRAPDSRAVAAVGGADFAVSGFACGADSGGVHVPEQVVEADRWVQSATLI